MSPVQPSSGEPVHSQVQSFSWILELLEEAEQTKRAFDEFASFRGEATPYPGESQARASAVDAGKLASVFKEAAGVGALEGLVAGERTGFRSARRALTDQRVALLSLRSGIRDEPRDPETGEPSRVIEASVASVIGVSFIRAGSGTSRPVAIALDALREASRRLDEALLELAVPLTENDWGRQKLSPVVEAARARQLSVSAQAFAGRAEKAALAAQQAAGQSAESSLAKHFKSLATKEECTANAMRAASVGLLSFLAYLAASAWGDRPAGESLSWTDLAEHLAVGAPFAALVFYLARLAVGHMEVARWASALAVQLKSVDAYGHILKNEDRASLLAQFGSRVFLEGPPEQGQATETPLSPSAELVQLTQAVAETAKAFAPNASGGDPEPGKATAASPRA